MYLFNMYPSCLECCLAFGNDQVNVTPVTFQIRSLPLIVSYRRCLNSPSFVTFVGLIVLESPVFLNGEIGRRIGKKMSIHITRGFRIFSRWFASPNFIFFNYILSLGWFKSTMGQKLSQDVKRREYRSNAATFLVAYLLGSPIQEFDLDPSR